MSEYKITMEGAQELIDDMNALMAQCPDDVNKAMRDVAKSWRKDCNDKMPASYDRGKRPFRKNWKTENQYGSLGIIEETAITNKSPHWHLVENGHAKYDFHGNPTGGFVPGKHYAEKTREEYKDKYPEMMSEAVNRLLNRNNL